MDVRARAGTGVYCKREAQGRAAGAASTRHQRRPAALGAHAAASMSHNKNSLRSRRARSFSYRNEPHVGSLPCPSLPRSYRLCGQLPSSYMCCARGRPIIVEWERDARHSAGLSLVR
ncbi:hypothetical protein EVAR_57390_1 [Eumeta japonica]|uniref:Uncharacterized protein n=1 Tax=Eumeta variegata TaxID=151549 RepID=A0A4C1ZEQ3_EUMVA|nr:hypothetical protein EVAR_57390_1 [Eumeta japonica]